MALIWAYVDVPARKARSRSHDRRAPQRLSGAAVHAGAASRSCRFNLFWKISPVIVLLLLLIGLFIPMGWGAPQGPALVVRNSVAIVPDVAGEVIEVPVEANKPLKAGDVLFRIDPVPYQAQVDALEAQLKFQETAPVADDAVAEQRTPAAASTSSSARPRSISSRRKLDGAKWNLDKTVVRAPADGYVTNVALRKGARVANLPLAPVMAFIDTSDTIIGVEIQQIDARYIAPGQPVEVTFKFMPGKVYTGKVESVLQAIATGQVQTSGSRGDAESDPVRAVRRARASSTTPSSPSACRPAAPATAAIFTDRVKAAHVIRKVLLRQIAITELRQSVLTLFFCWDSRRRG